MYESSRNMKHAQFQNFDGGKDIISFEQYYGRIERKNVPQSRPFRSQFEQYYGRIEIDKK